MTTAIIMSVSWLKGLAQAKIIKKAVIYIGFLNMTISCKHVHRLKLNVLLYAWLQLSDST